MDRFTTQLQACTHYTRCIQEGLEKQREEPAWLVCALFQTSSETFRNAFAVHSVARGNFQSQILITWCQLCSGLLKCLTTSS